MRRIIVVVVSVIVVIFLVALTAVTVKAYANDDAQYAPGTGYPLYPPDPLYWYRHPDGTCVQRPEMLAPKPPTGFVLDEDGICEQPNEGRPNGAGQ